MKFHIGQGADVHAFCTGDHVVLGGVHIPHERALAGHSDGDVALHALCDALLGAAALGDLGRHFPPTDQKWAGADSRDILRETDVLIKHAGWSVVNADITLVCEQPKIAPHVELMRANIAADLGLDQQDVSIKATTTDTLGFCGRGEGIAALAVVLVKAW